MKIQLQKAFSLIWLRRIIFCKGKQVETLGDNDDHETGEMDRISQLPDFILHHILSFCNTPTDLVRMSALSKTWFHLTASNPILDFKINTFTSRESFFKYLDYTISRFCHHNLPAHTFKLVTSIRGTAELDVVNRCLELLLKRGVKVFEIHTASTKYRLPNILLSVSALTSLTMRDCLLPSSFTVDAVMFKSLIYLRLVSVAIDDKAITHLATSCPLLQVFQVSYCYGFKSFCVLGHQNLQKVEIGYNARVERIDIEAPNLSTLFIKDRYGNGAPQMNLALCKKLTKVVYKGHPLPNSNGFTDFLSNFPFIEYLFLSTTYKCNNLKLSSHSLRALVLQSNYDLENIEFSTPKLLIFSYTCNDSGISSMVMNKRWPMLGDSTHFKTCMHCYPDGCVDTLWFQKLRQFLDKKNGFKVLNLFIFAKYSQIFLVLEELKALGLPPYELEYVELHLESHEKLSDHVAIVDAVLLCCRPQSLTLRSSIPLTVFKEQSDLVKFTYKKLLEQEDHSHTNIRIVSPSSKAQKHFRGLMCEGKAISFIKEEGTLFLLAKFIDTFFTLTVISKQSSKTKQLGEDLGIWRFSEALELGVYPLGRDYESYK